MLFLAGCGSAGGSSGSGSEGVSLTIWADDKYSRAIKESATKWGELNDVQVNVQAVSKDLQTVFVTAAQAGKGPDLVMGAQIVVHFEVDAPKVVTADTEDVPTHEIEGTKFVAAFAPRSRVRVGDQIEVVVDTERMHFFDPETGNAIRG
jgi:ABC-type glycerol-3-phosphate transport system substrate-binding protein